MLEDLKGKLAIIGGGLGLLGRVICQGLRDHGAIVRPVDIKDGEDINDLEIEDLLMCCIKMGTTIFINASYPKDPEKHLRVFTKTTQAFAQHMPPGGTIINFASIYGFLAPRYRIYGDTSISMPDWYGVAKAGVIQITKILATRFAPRGVRINCISPGGIFNDQPKEFVENYCKETPMRRMGVPEDVVGPVLFLASDMSRYVTGINLVVDGGFSL